MAVWAVTVLFALVTTAWSVVTPVTQSPDEPNHVGLVLHLAEGNPYPDFDGLRANQATFAASMIYRPGLFADVWLTPELAPPRGERGTFADWGDDGYVDRPNQMPQHPPLYYWGTAAALRTERALWPGADLAMEQEWHLLRLLNVLMLVPVPVLAWATARRLGAGDVGATAAAVVPLAVPQLTHIGGAVNNDNLLVLLGALVAFQVAGVLRGDVRVSTGAWLGVTTGLALLTKAFAIIFPPWIALAYGYRWWRRREDRRRSVVALAVAGAVTAAIWAWWPVRNLIRHGDPAPGIGGRLVRPGFEADLVGYLRTFASSITHRFWGHFGWFDPPLPRAAVVVATAMALVAAVWAFRRGRPGSSGRAAVPPRVALAVFAALFPLLLALVLQRAWSVHVRTGRMAFIQGRYLFAALIPFAVVVAVGLARLIGRRAPVIVLVGAGVMQAAGVHAVLQRWWAEPDASLHRSLAAVVRWSPWPPVLTTGIAVAVPIAGVIAAVALLADRDGGAGWRTATTPAQSVAAPS